MKRLDENHSFNCRVAAIVGVPKAILLKEIYGWCLDNYLNKRNCFGEIPFTYNSSSAYGKKFFYLPERSIDRWLRELEKDGWIASSKKMNKKRYDRTKAYTISFQRYDDAVLGKEWTIPQIEECITHFEESITQIEESITQNEETIPSLTHLLPSPSLEKKQTRTRKNKAPKKPKEEKEKVPKDYNEVKEYFDVLGSTEAKAREFWNHFESNGWKVSGRTPMQKWRNAAENWANRKFVRYGNNKQTSEEKLYDFIPVETVRRARAMLMDDD